MTNISQDISEEQLVALLQSKEEKVLSILYERYSMALFGVIYRVLGDQKLAEDQLQECFLKIWNYAGSYDASKGRLYTWMLRIARNTAIDATRSKSFKQQQKIQNLDNSVNVIDRKKSFELNVDTIGVKELIKQLNTKYALVIDKIYFQGFTQAETAQELNLPLGTVKSRTRKALGLLKQYLTE